MTTLRQRLCSRTTIAFILVGMLNTLFGYATYALFIYVDLHYSLAAFLSTILGVLFNFKTTGRLVFKSRDNSLLIRFLVVYVVVYLANVAGLRLYGIFDDNMYLAGLLMIVPAAVLSFVLLSRFVFTGEHSRAYVCPTATDESAGHDDPP